MNTIEAGGSEDPLPSHSSSFPPSSVSQSAGVTLGTLQDEYKKVTRLLETLPFQSESFKRRIVGLWNQISIALHSDSRLSGELDSRFLFSGVDKTQLVHNILVISLRNDIKTAMREKGVAWVIK